MNSVCLTGRIATDLNLETTGSGVEYVNFRLAVDRDYKDKNGERGCDFFDVVAWRKTAVFLNTYMKKGSAVELTGQLETDSWTNEHGEKRSRVKIKVDSIKWTPSQPKDADSTGASYAAPATAPAPAAPTTPAPTYSGNLIEDDDDNDDLLDDGDLLF